MNKYFHIFANFVPHPGHTLKGQGKQPATKYLKNEAKTSCKI
jgi:hypothetical protein